MAQNRIRGITIEIDGNTTKLQAALKEVNTQLSKTGTALKDVNSLLKLDPGNVDLLRQKQTLLTTAIDDTKKKLDQEKEALKQATANAPNYADWQRANEPIQKAIDETRERLKKLKDQAEETQEAMSQGKASTEQYDAIQAEIKETEISLKDLRAEQKRVSDEFGNPVCPKTGEQFTFLGNSGGKNRSLRCKWVCPKSVQNGNSRLCTCETPCTDSSYGKCVYTYPDKNFRDCPGIPRNTEHWDNLYKHRVLVERTINIFKGSFGLNSLKTRNPKTIKADLLLAGCTQLIGVILAKAIHQVDLYKSVRKIVALAS